MKVGDYVRTKYGIAKYISDKVTRITIYRVIDKDIVYDNIEGWENVLLDNGIIKSSPNIIDLIEEGDYVNGIYIEGNKGKYLETLEHDIENSSLGHIEYLKIYPKDIKSIVTREMFESMEYKVGE